MAPDTSSTFDCVMSPEEEGVSLFATLELLPPDAGLEQLPIEFAKCSFEGKVGLGAGVYCTDEGVPWTLPVVQKVRVPLYFRTLMPEVKQLINDDPRCNHSYLPISGDPQFLSSARALIFASSPPVNMVSIQTLGGTGANHLGALLLCRANTRRTTRVWISDPTWQNHHEIWDLLGAKRQVYPYFNRGSKRLDFEGMMNTLDKAEKGDVVLLHACCHNPTGVDPTKEQWIKIADLMARRGLIPFLDAA